MFLLRGEQEVLRRCALRIDRGGTYDVGGKCTRRCGPRIDCSARLPISGLESETRKSRRP
jgi:hypothetical protein